MVDVNLAGTSVDEADGRAGVGVGGQGPGQNLAGVLHLLALEVPAQDVVAGVASVAVCVEPGLAELCAGVAGLRGTALDGQPCNGGKRGTGNRGLGLVGCRRWQGG